VGPRCQPRPLPPVVTGTDTNDASTESNHEYVISYLKSMRWSYKRVARVLLFPFSI
jgi:hypothetical protein